MRLFFLTIAVKTLCHKSTMLSTRMIGALISVLWARKTRSRFFCEIDASSSVYVCFLSENTRHRIPNVHLLLSSTAFIGPIISTSSSCSPSSITYCIQPPTCYPNLAQFGYQCRDDIEIVLKAHVVIQTRIQWNSRIDFHRRFSMLNSNDLITPPLHIFQLAVAIGLAAKLNKVGNHVLYFKSYLTERWLAIVIGDCQSEFLT